MYVRVRDDPDYETKVGGVVPDPAIFKKLNSYVNVYSITKFINILCRFLNINAITAAQSSISFIMGIHQRIHHKPALNAADPEGKLYPSLQASSKRLTGVTLKTAGRIVIIKALAAAGKPDAISLRVKSESIWKFNNERNRCNQRQRRHR